MNRRERRAAAKQSGSPSPGGASIEPEARLLAEAAAHHRAGRLAAAERLYRRILAVDPDHADSLHLLGLIAHQTGHSDQALELIGRAIELNAADPELHNDIGGIYHSRGRFDLAVEHCRKAMALDPRSAATGLNLARALQAQGELAEAIAQYRRVLQARPDMAEAHYGLAVALQDLGNIDQAIGQYRRALVLRPDHSEAHINLGISLAAKGLCDAAIVHYRQALAIEPDSVEVLNALGVALTLTGQPMQAIDAVRRALKLQPDHVRARANLVYTMAQACSWAGFEAAVTQLLALLRQGAEGVPPFVMLMLSATPADRLLATRRWSHAFTTGAARLAHPRPAAPRPIRLGYLSHDLRGDVVGWLLPELIERHDRSRFVVNAYCYGPDDGSAARRRLVAAFDGFADLTGLDDAAAARHIHRDGIDILVDLTGYTSQNPRARVLAHRPAPIQVSFLGFPGTMGADFIDYLIVDPFLAPAEQQPLYSERLVRLPHCYLPSDTSRPVVPPAARADCGLPAEGLVFCCFNQSYKLTPAVFDIWMRLLRAVPDSTLWLYQANSAVPDNLRHEATARGVAAERLVFARQAPVPEYLARLAAADLFLDTAPYNAGATANDALWAGLPVLTCSADNYVGRMAGSMLHAVGLPGLVTHSLAEYEARALQLAREPARLAELRRRLVQNRARMPLFDMARYTQDIEAAYSRMWERWRADEPPAPFDVTAG
jgi:predicted O-linked N-acetylglucosamine transferase (SPINDLY family)